MRVRLFSPRRLDPVLDGGVGDEDAVVTPQVPTGGLVGQAIFSDQADGPLLDALSVAAIRQSQIGKITGEARAAAEAAMPREGNDQIDGAIGPSIPEVVEGPGAHGVAAGTLATARARSPRAVAAAPLQAWLGQVFDPADAFGDIRNIVPWSSHRMDS
jgi:hypothetical protein